MSLLLINGILSAKPHVEEDDGIPIPNQVDSRATFVEIVNPSHDYQRGGWPIKNADGETYLDYDEGTQHTYVDGTGRVRNAMFIAADGVTQSEPNEDLNGNPIITAPWVAEGDPVNHLISEGVYIRCPNDDLIYVAMEFSISPLVHTTTYQWRSTDGGKTWVVDFDWCDAVGFANPQRIHAAYNAQVIGTDIFVTCSESATNSVTGLNSRTVICKSPDNGATWSLYSTPIPFGDPPSGSECDFCDFGGGNWLFFIRTEVDLNKSYIKISNDYGITWGDFIEVTDIMGGGVHQPRLYKFDNFVLLTGRNAKADTTYMHCRCAFWTTTTDIDTAFRSRTTTIKTVCDPFFSGSGDDETPNHEGDSGYLRAVTNDDGTFTMYGYFCVNGHFGPARMYRYQVSHAESPTLEIYFNHDFAMSGTGIELQMNKDATLGIQPPVLGGEAVVSRAHNTYTSSHTRLGKRVWEANATPGARPEYWRGADGRGWYIFGGTSLLNEVTSTVNSFCKASFSIGFWLWPDDGQPAASQLLLWANSVTTTSLTHGIQANLGSDGRILFRYAVAGTLVTANTNDVIFSNGAQSSPKYIAATFTSGDLIRIYIDGVLVANHATSTGNMSTVTMASFSSTGMINLGMRRTGASTWDSGYIGKMRQLRITTGVWDATRVANEMLN